MKLIFLSALMLASLLLNAQSYEYHPFPKDTGIWKHTIHDDYWNQIGWQTETYCSPIGLSDTMWKNEVGYYELNKRIYHGQSDSSFNLLFDFYLTVGDTAVYIDSTDFWIVATDDSTGYHGRRVLHLENNAITWPTTMWVEGIGNVNSYYSSFDQLSFGSVSGGNLYVCTYSDSVSFPCANARPLSIPHLINKSYTIYPNPTKSIIHFTNPPKEIKVYNQLGNLSSAYRCARRLDEIDISNLRNGTYYLEIIYQNEIVHEMIIKN